MAQDITALLTRYDDPMHRDCPAGFDYRAARKRTAAFVADLTRRLGQQAVGALDVRVEDASFHSEVSFPGGSGSLRFSSFGDMIALTPDYELTPVIVDAITDLARTYGYVLVPTSALETPYAGQHPGVNGIRTWWIRYFDYL